MANDPQVPWPVSTQQLRHVIQAADVSPAYRSFVIEELTKAGVFEQEVIGSLQLGFLLGKYISLDPTKRDASLDTIMADIANLDKLPILT